VVYDALKKKMQERTTFGELKNCIRNSLEPYLFKKTNRNPIVIPVILNMKAAIAEIQAKTGGNTKTRTSRTSRTKEKEEVKEEKKEEAPAESAE